MLAGTAFGAKAGFECRSVCDHKIVTAHSRRIRVADQQQIEFLFRLVLIVWIVVTIATLWVAASQGHVRAAQPPHLHAAQHRALTDYESLGGFRSGGAVSSREGAVLS